MTADPRVGNHWGALESRVQATINVDGQAPRIAEFLAVETRQVWALRCDTEEPVYLPVGAAKEMRAQARAELMCPYPGCVAEISTRGGSRPDGFFHLKAPGHDTGFESEAHLAGKAMVAAWAEDRNPRAPLCTSRRR